jgi:3-hydroxyisobutyrate dehydrogenase-like beta-hydroxyacid dehydrogenase
MSRRSSRKNVGLIGLGIIGRRVAENLRKRGFHVFVWNRTPRPVPNFVGSPAEVAELCNVIQLFVGDDEALREIVQQLSPVLTAHHIVTAHCTVAPDSMQAAAEIVQRRGARFLDAPFTGSRTAAEKGELVYYIAGDDGAISEARHFLEASSKEILEFGDVGEATLIKLATNMVTAASVQSVAEALALVTKCGVPPEKFQRALGSNASQSGTIAMKLPKMMDGDFEPQFSVKHMLKDLQIAERLADSLELKFPVTEAARDVQLSELKTGHGDEDYSCVVRQYFPDGVPTERKVAAEAAEETSELDLESKREPEKPAEKEPEKVLAPEPKKAVAPEPEETIASEPGEMIASEPEETGAEDEPEEESAPEPEKARVSETESAPEVIEEAPAAVAVESPPESKKTKEESETRPGFLRRLFTRGADNTDY